MSLASRLPYDHPYAGGYPGIGSQPLPTDADAIDYLSRMATADGAGVETGVAVAVDAFFRDLKATGQEYDGLYRTTFESLKACCILAGARTLAGALVPVVGTAPTNLPVANGFVEGDYTRGGATPGLAGDGTSYLDSGYAYPAALQNDCHISTFVTERPSVGLLAGYGDSLGSGTLIGMALCRVYNTHTATFYPSDTTSVGLRAANRGNSASFVYRRASANETASIASTSVTHLNMAVFARQRNTLTPDSITNATIAFYSIGTALSLEDLDTAVTNLINRLKFALLVGENPSGLDPDTIDYVVRGYEAGGSLE